MVIRRYQDLDTWKLTEAFKDEVHRIVLGSPEARSDLRYRGQILDAANRPSSDVAEGFMRFSPGDFARFLDYAVGSVAETERRLHDGVKVQYFPEPRCREAFQLARRCTAAIIKLKQSQVRYRAERRDRERAARHKQT
jgi:four helix bundle protein